MAVRSRRWVLWARLFYAAKINPVFIFSSSGIVYTAFKKGGGMKRTTVKGFGRDIENTGNNIQDLVTGADKQPSS